MQGLTYAVDLALVIDLTGSMSPILDEVKARATVFHEDVSAALATKGKEIDHLRVRLVGFRDFFVDGADSIYETDFFELPAQASAFAEAVREMRATGGGDEPESGLEALAIAMRSDWTREGTRQRQVIAVWTDASTHPIEKAAAAKPENLPAGLPSTFDELTDDWHGQTYMSRTGQRLLLFAPDAAAWSDISADWENTIHFQSKGGQGLDDISYSAILDTIANSV